jgi:hypothetical protein
MAVAAAAVAAATDPSLPGPSGPFRTSTCAAAGVAAGRAAAAAAAAAAGSGRGRRRTRGGATQSGRRSTPSSRRAAARYGTGRDGNRCKRFHPDNSFKPLGLARWERKVWGRLPVTR